jgi:hypothetical protein
VVGPLLGRLGLGGALSDWGDVLGGNYDFSTPGAIAYGRGAVIAGGVRAGQSANSILRGLQTLGIGINRAVGLDAIRAVAGQIAASQTAQALQLDMSSGELLTGNPPANWTGQYVHQVTGTFRTRTTGGGYELSSRTLGIKSSSALSPGEAASAAMDILETPIGEEDVDSYGAEGDLVGLSLTGAWYDTNPGATGRIGR